MESKQNPLHVTESAFDLVDLMKFKNINLLRFFLLTDGKSSEKSVENREINGIPTQIQIWDIDRFYSLEKGEGKASVKSMSYLLSHLSERRKEITELERLAKILGTTSSSFSTEDFTKLNITKSINLQIGPSEMKSMTPKRAKAIARAIELSLILKKNREENIDD